MKDYIAVIQAGGMGTRLVELTQNKVPKPLFPLDGKPMMQWQIENLRLYGITEIVIIIGHLGEKIKEYFRDGEALGVHISYIEEKEPLGSAGALYYLKENIKNKDILLIFGDVMFDIDITRMIHFHENKNAQITLLMHPNSHPYDSDVLLVDDNQKVTGILSKKVTRQEWYDNCTNAGIYILNGKVFDIINEPKKTDLELDVIVPCIRMGTVFGYHTSEYVKDAGTVERFRIAEEEHKEGIWEKRNLRNKQKCVFLDRDGTINVFKGLLHKEEMFELEKGVPMGIRKLNESGFLVIVITNQPAVARGMCEEKDIKQIHRKMQVLLGKEGAYVDDIVYCPHHPDKGYPEENPKYKIKCECRKPAVGMINEMVKKYHIDLEQSYFIGDSTVDIQTGKNAGVKTILLKTGQAGLDGKYDVEADFTAEDLVSAIEDIVLRR